MLESENWDLLEIEQDNWKQYNDHNVQCDTI